MDRTLQIRLRDALGGAFPDEAALDQQLLAPLHKSLRELSSSADPYSKKIQSIIETAAAEGWIAELMTAATACRPADAALEQIVAEISAQLPQADIGRLEKSVGLPASPAAWDRAWVPGAVLPVPAAPAGYFLGPFQVPETPAASAPPPAPPFESLRPASPATEARARTRSAYGLLRCPDSVVVGVEIELAVGLSQDPDVGVAGGRFSLPDRAFDLVVQIVAQGFRLRPGESFRQTLHVTPAAPFPTFVLHLTPELTDSDLPREIHASYTVEGQPVGFAMRYVTVARPGTAEPAAESPATGVNIPVPTAERGADLTVVIRRQSGAIGTLLWTFESRHPLALPDRAIETSIGEAPQDYTLRLMTQVNQNPAAAYELLVGHGRLIGQLMPDEFWQLLGAATILSPRPTVLVMSEDPFVPWELAIADEPIEAAPAASPFLGARAVVGRWVQPAQNRKRPPLPPPSQVRIDVAAVVSGTYTQGAQRLEEAEAEAAEIFADLAADLGSRASKVDATQAAVLECLGGKPAGINLLHFSLHGSFDRTGLEDGLLLVDNNFLLPDQVRGVSLPGRPFVFLNACQVGQGTALLGVYAGMAAAFLFAGASAVIAPLWSIDDKIAHAIARSFYAATLHGSEPVSAAELLRRERAKFVSNAQSATFVAYQFFGHPEMTLSLGRAAGPLAA